MDFRFGETVTRQRAAPEVDPYSDKSVEQDWEAPYELDIPGCGFDPGGSSEPTEVGRTAVITRPEVYAPYGSDILAGDRLVVRGEVFEVQGDPSSWRSPFTGWTPGLVVRLEKVAG